MDVGSRGSLSKSRKRVPVLLKKAEISSSRSGPDDTNKTSHASCWSWLKQKVRCCKKADNGLNNQGIKESNLNHLMVGLGTLAKSAIKQQDTDKISPKNSKDRRKTLVLEVTNLLIYLKNPNLSYQLIFSQGQSMSSVNPHDSVQKSSTVKKLSSQELKPILRPTFERFLKEISPYYEVMLWSTAPRKVRSSNQVLESPLRELDPKNYVRYKLYGDKCKTVKGTGSGDTFLVKDLSILKRPLCSVVVLDVARFD